MSDNKIDFVLFSSNGWRTMDGAHRPAQIASDLLLRGHRVLFVELEDSPDRPNDENLQVVSRFATGITEREITRAWYGQAYGALEGMRAGMSALLDRFERPGAKRVAVWAIPFAPLVELAPLLKARGYYLVYDCLDDFAGLQAADYFLYFPEVEDYLITQSDLVMVVSSTLRDKFQGRTDRLMLVPNGINLQDFANVPPHPQDPAALRLGWWGTLNHFMVDIPLLEHVARSRPAWQIDLIGPYDADPLTPPVTPRLAAYPNIHLLGRRPHSKLREYLANFDVCLIPSPADEFNAGRDPVKSYEYLAGYRPVVATALPQLAAMPYVYLASSPDDFIAKVERAAATPVDHAQVDHYLAEQTWACRVDALLAGIEQHSPRTQIAPFVAPQPKPSLAAAQAYIHQLEQLMDERVQVIARLHAALSEAGIRPALRRLWRRLR